MHISQVKIGQYLINHTSSLCRVQDVFDDADGVPWVDVRVKGCSCPECLRNGGTQFTTSSVTLRVPGVVTAFRKKLWRFR